MRRIMTVLKYILVITLTVAFNLSPLTVFAGEETDIPYEEWGADPDAAICPPLTTSEGWIEIKYVDYFHGNTGLEEPEQSDVVCLEHAWDDGVITKESTYAAPGEIVYTCANCAETKNEIIPQLECNDHKWDGGKIIKEATCSEEGVREYTCSNCGEVKNEKIACKDHDTEWIVTKEPTDKVEGEKELRCKSCNTVLKKEKIEKTKTACSHPSPYRPVEKVKATCTQRQVVDLYCTQCGELVRENVMYYTDPSNHTNLQERVIKEPTYDEPGKIRYYCPDCKYENDKEIPELDCDHPSTCIYDDSATGKSFVKCNVCKRLLYENTMPIIACCSHSFGQEEVCITPADETHWGEYQMVCKRCGKVMSTEKVHPYSAYTLTDQNGQEVTVYGWFDDDYAQQVYELTNAYREENGLNTLRYNSTEQEASNTRALEAAIYFDHYRPTGERWNTLSENWLYGGENLAKGQNDPEWVMESWKNSEGHNSNLLYGIQNGKRPYTGLSVGCFHMLKFDDKNKPSVPREWVVWSQNFTFR